MLTDYPVSPTIPVADVEKAKDFYQNTLGLKVSDMSMPDGVLFEAGGGSRLYIYQRTPTMAEHTLASFMVDDVNAVVSDLKNKGVEFEQYDMPNGIKTDENGVAEMGGVKSAWFKDPDGNILAVVQPPS
jgi:catechol 2,3-dioxygenase-like lactoylglutathione lyase family enzyme